MANGPFVKVYQSIVDDPDMAEVYADDHLLATWLRLLLVADAMWPASAPSFGKAATVERLATLGIVIALPGHRYSIRGLQSERTRRSNAGRTGAAMRWQSGGNADGNAVALASQSDPNASRAEQSRADQTRGQSPTMMGWKPRSAPPPERLPGEAVGARHNGQHPNCGVCHPVTA